MGAVVSGRGAGDELPGVGGEHVHGEGLGQYVHARPQVAVAEHRVLGKARDKQDLDARPRIKEALTTG
ncbi:hypothetical protein [Muricoccus nepalensis]|uniref:hypothetical protein n=1 Tax=Muricoccus nepalensis TaxID=1854500 RepID=UPI001386D7D8|nr:hypothetical protein [Roseomonas nepalensis]